MPDLRQRNKSKESNLLENGKDDLKEISKENLRNQQSSSKNISLRVFSRVIVIFSLLIVVYFSSKNDKVKIFARQTDLLAGKGQILDCSPDYLKDIDKYEGCFPKECKRFVTDKVVSMRETEELLTIIQKGLKLHDAEGITTLDLDSGTLINDQQNLNIYKNEDSAFSPSDFNIYRIVKEKIKYAIAHHFGADPNKIYLTRPALLCQIKPLSSKKRVVNNNNNNEYWQPHVDHDGQKFYHFTAMLYLSDYEKDFKGGRFMFVDDKANETIEPKKNRLSMFTSGGENQYYDEKVTSGVKYTVTLFFTCDKMYAINDPGPDKYVN